MCQLSASQQTWSGMCWETGIVMGVSFPEDNTALFLCLLAFTFLQLSFLQCALGGDGMSVLFMAAHASIIRSQHLLHPQDSAFAALYWKEMLL